MGVCVWVCVCVCVCERKQHTNYCKKDSHYGKDYRVSSMAAPWQLNRVWAGLHCLVSTRVTQSEWMASHTRTHAAYMQACLRCGVWAGLCTQSLISADDRLHTQTHTQASEPHTNSANMQQSFPGEQIHTSHSVFCRQGGLHRCPTPATLCIWVNKKRKFYKISHRVGLSTVVLPTVLKLKWVWEMLHIRFLVQLICSKGLSEEAVRVAKYTNVQ